MSMKKKKHAHTHTHVKLPAVGFISKSLPNLILVAQKLGKIILGAEFVSAAQAHPIFHAPASAPKTEARVLQATKGTNRKVLRPAQTTLDFRS